MKKINFLLLFVSFAFIYFGCSESEVDPPQTEDTETEDTEIEDFITAFYVVNEFVDDTTKNEIFTGAVDNDTKNIDLEIKSLDSIGYKVVVELADSSVSVISTLDETTDFSQPELEFKVGYNGDEYPYTISTNFTRIPVVSLVKDFYLVNGTDTVFSEINTEDDIVTLYFKEYETIGLEAEIELLEGTKVVTELTSSTDYDSLQNSEIIIEYNNTQYSLKYKVEKLFSKRAYHSSVVFDNEIYVIGGTDGNRLNDVWKSSDGGKSWVEVTSSAPFTERYTHSNVVLGNDIYVIGGASEGRLNDVWKSSDGGKSWVEVTSSAPFTKRADQSSLVLNNEIYVIGGYDGTRLNDVWKSSDDGKSWVEVTSSAPFTERSSHNSVVLGDDIYVIGGYYENYNRLNDVWKSSDGGKSWVEATSSAPFTKRSGHSCVVLGDDIYVIGGSDENYNRLNDVWKSSDGGKSWVEVTSSATFTKRTDHSSLVLDNEIYVIGGDNGYGKLNDVWKSSDGGKNWVEVSNFK
ncbi:hypothetical protein KMW28_21490 [Flammeovirga yaeyamensis]|uniref:Uncharacterized protein n=1 Tax=Flammeovirga yaeyamensis TaxID=367791 RepID=A0AAX1NBW1_9BACT|nr:kelch repeat-containing protein [Flammeovirga yaeyamensis]MBB3697073.1 photosystem II stability/assembly factor-like uncharacterized protein [Flammeovirga yaeyamensis]NMF33735.1 hypothetical protein [Flammeovirga yaeyamensis]QWG04999.1 hypothetical protein KMW28_21490 [Flammeovirga yaeyamensis]